MMVVLTFIASPCANSPSHISPPLLLVGGCPGRVCFLYGGGVGGGGGATRAGPSTMHSSGRLWVAVEEDEDEDEVEEEEGKKWLSE